MDEQRIWAPWRIGYVAGKEDASAEVAQPIGWRDDADESCFLCRAAADYEDPEQVRRQNLVVEVGACVSVVLNRYPYANGHLLVSPLRHVAQLHELTDAEHLEAAQMLAHYTQRLAKAIRASGFNIGLNLGNVAGAGVPGHLHWHVVPRWPGDVNFMPVTAGIRVIPQSLEAVWEALAEANA